MIKINLLSPDDKINIKWEKINSFVRANIFVIVFIQVLVVICFVITIVYVDIENKNVAEEIEDTKLRSETEELESIKIDAKRYDQESRSLLGIQEGQVYWTRVFDHLSQITPPEVKIESISIEPKTITDETRPSSKNKIKINPNVFEVKISGTSKKKSDLKQFEDNLEESDIFSGFEPRPENYVNEVFSCVLSIEKNLLIEN